MKTKVTFEQSKKRLHDHYRRIAQSCLKKDKLLLEKPTTALREELIELRGYLRGIKKTLSFVEELMSDNELDFGKEAS